MFDTLAVSIHVRNTVLDHASATARNELECVTFDLVGAQIRLVGRGGVERGRGDGTLGGRGAAGRSGGRVRGSGDLFGLVASVVALDLDVLAAQRVAGDGGGDLKQK
jgi:hypothetical protein